MNRPSALPAALAGLVALGAVVSPRPLESTPVHEVHGLGLDDYSVHSLFDQSNDPSQRCREFLGALAMEQILSDANGTGTGAIDPDIRRISLVAMARLERFAGQQGVIKCVKDGAL